MALGNRIAIHYLRASITKRDEIQDQEITSDLANGARSATGEIQIRLGENTGMKFSNAFLIVALILV